MHERRDERQPAGRRRASRGKNPRQRKNTSANGSDGHRVVHQLVGHPAEQQKADHVDRLDQELLDLAVANLPGDARRQARHAGKGPGDHRQQVVGDEIVVGVAGDRLWPSRWRTASNTAVHRKICVTIGRNRISVPSAKSPR